MKNEKIAAMSNDERSVKSCSVWTSLPGLRESSPGLLAIVIIALFCGLPGVSWLPNIEDFLRYIDQVLPPIYGKGLFLDLLHFNYVVIALVVGMLIRNMIGVPKSWEPGLSYSAVFMNTGIIMLGSQYMLRDLVKLGAQSITIMVIMVFGTAALGILLGRFFKIGDRLTALLAAAFSMCGVSAVVAIAPMVRAKSEEVAYAIACLVSFGIFCLFILPVIGRLLEMSHYSFGILSATGVPNSAQVIATGFNFSFEAGKVAGFANIGRIVLIPAGVLFVYSFALAKELKGEEISYWEVIKEKFPVFVFGFIIVWVANCMHLWPQPATVAMEKVMTWFFTFCFVGIGLQTKFSDMKKAGVKGILVGYGAGILKVLISLALIMIATKIGFLK
jgi:uncharacterized integral membrane protein (TIGR00698 family)